MAINVTVGGEEWGGGRVMWLKCGEEVMNVN
jgi:hypothetical protein